MILVAFGANLPGPLGSACAAYRGLAGCLAEAGVRVLSRSPAFRTRALCMEGKPDDAPFFVNAVMRADSTAAPEALLARFQRIERRFGRASAQGAARSLDLDLIDHHGRVTPGWPLPAYARALVLPHPRAHLRAFVLAPLRAVAPGWRHPVIGRSAQSLLEASDRILPFCLPLDVTRGRMRGRRASGRGFHKR